jgi:AraC-like DNA-binding protein
MPTFDRNVRIVSQDLGSSPIGCVRRAAYITDSRGLRSESMRVLGSFALVYVIRGRGYFRDASGRESDVRQGDVIFLFPEIGHRYGPRGEETWNEFYVLFEGDTFDMWRSAGLLDPDHPILHLEPIGYWLKRLESAVARDGASTSTDQHSLTGVCMLQQVLAEMLAHVSEGRIDHEDREWLERAYHVLDQSFVGDDVNWEEIAGELGMSYENFRKKFSKLAGMPPAKYRMRRVMERAGELLHRSRLTLKEVADRCGFCNEFHFSRRFKQIVGLSPREFRRQRPQ